MFYKGFTCNWNSEVKQNKDGNLIKYNDIFLDDTGNIAISDEGNSILETAYHKLLLLFAEYDYNKNIGIDWQSYIASIENKNRELKATIIDNIITIKGIKEVRDIVLENDNNTRKLNIYIEIMLTNGILKTINLKNVGEKYVNI